MTEETAAKLKKATQGSVPAWFGSGGLIALIVAQAFGLDPAALTGKGAGHQVTALEQRLERMDNAMVGASARIRTVEQSVGILFERTDTAKEDRAEIKRRLEDINRAMGQATSSLARIEAKLDRN